jgi:sugar lactone lactonase YvrE
MDLSGCILTIVCALSTVAVEAVDRLEAATIQTIAGTGEAIDGGEGGLALATNLVQPFDVELGPDGALYICEFGAHRIRRLDLKTKRISNVAGTGEAGYSGDGGPATKARLNQPHEMQFDREGNLYFTDMRNHAIRKIAAKTGIITTLAGTANRDLAATVVPLDQRSSTSRTVSVLMNRALSISPMSPTIACDAST